MRGRAFAINQAVMLSAVPIVAALSWWLVPLSPHGIDGWRWVVLIGAAASMIIWVLRLFVPESPLWLARHGRAAEAERIMRTPRGCRQAQRGHGPSLQRGGASTPRRPRAGFADLFRPPYASLVVLFMIFNLCQAFGVYGFANWVPALLVEKGINVTKSLQYSFIIAVAYPLAPLSGRNLRRPLRAQMDHLRRRRRDRGVRSRLRAAHRAGAADRKRRAGDRRQHDAVLRLSRLPDRGVPDRDPGPRAAGLVYSMSRLSATFSGFIVAFMLKSAGVGGVFGLITAAMIIVIVAIGIWGPNVRGRPLDA